MMVPAREKAGESLPLVYSSPSFMPEEVKTRCFQDAQDPSRPGWEMLRCHRIGGICAAGELSEISLHRHRFMRSPLQASLSTLYLSICRDLISNTWDDRLREDFGRAFFNMTASALCIRLASKHEVIVFLNDTNAHQPRQRSR